MRIQLFPEASFIWTRGFTAQLADYILCLCLSSDILPILPTSILVIMQFNLPILRIGLYGVLVSEGVASWTRCELSTTCHRSSSPSSPSVYPLPDWIIQTDLVSTVREFCFVACSVSHVPQSPSLQSSLFPPFSPFHSVSTCSSILCELRIC